MIYVRSNSEPVGPLKRTGYVRADKYQRIYQFFPNGKNKVQYEVGTVFDNRTFSDD